MTLNPDTKIGIFFLGLYGAWFVLLAIVYRVRKALGK